MTLDLELALRELLEDCDGLVERLVRVRQQGCFVRLEVDALDDASELLQLRRDLVGATVFVLEAVLRLRLVGALVLGIGHAVTVVIRVGQPFVLEAVFVFGFIRALVVGVEDAVVVVIWVRAAVFVLEAVFVFGFVRALVLRVRDAVTVVVGIRATVFDPEEPSLSKPGLLRISALTKSLSSGMPSPSEPPGPAAATGDHSPASSAGPTPP